MSTQIGTLIETTLGVRNGRPCIAGTGISVHRIAIWYKLGHSPEEIARRYGHITEAQVFAAIAYYHANRDEIEADLSADAAEEEILERQALLQRPTVG
jgi:uncharacterized protein (DUF433 family)